MLGMLNAALSIGGPVSSPGPGVVRNGYLLHQTIQTGMGDVEIKLPKGQGGGGIAAAKEYASNNSLIAPYLKRVKNIGEFASIAVYLHKREHIHR
ncbi:MAG: hypothetical protein ACTS73_08330 [Arsenophonus sp. NEOnobi-MAG3]